MYYNIQNLMNDLSEFYSDSMSFFVRGSELRVNFTGEIRSRTYCIAEFGHIFSLGQYEGDEMISFEIVDREEIFNMFDDLESLIN